MTPLHRHTSALHLAVRAILAAESALRWLGGFVRAERVRAVVCTSCLGSAKRARCTRCREWIAGNLLDHRHIGPPSAVDFETCPDCGPLGDQAACGPGVRWEVAR